MPALSFNTALREIERSLHRAIRWQLLALAGTVSTVADLRAVSTQSNGQSATPPFTPYFVSTVGLRYEWSRASVDLDDGVKIIQPADVAAGAPGRWLRTTSSSTGGYLVAVNFWQGETKKAEFQSRVFSVSPSVAIIWESSDNDPRSTTPGAIYDYPCRFSIWCIDENLRPDYEAFFGSPYDFDVLHPGAIQLLGDVKQLLADENKRLVQPGDPDSGILSLSGGAKIVKVLGEDVEDADLAERVMVLSLGIEVIGSIENPDSPAEHQAVTSIYVQPELTELHQQAKFDPAGYIVSGYQVGMQSGFTAAPSSGSAVIAGVSVTSSPGAFAYFAISDTYLDLNPDGTITYLAVVNGGPAPPVTIGSLRIGYVTTDSLGITAFSPIAASSVPYGAAYPVIPKSSTVP